MIGFADYLLIYSNRNKFVPEIRNPERKRANFFEPEWLHISDQQFTKLVATNYPSPPPISTNFLTYRSVLNASVSRAWQTSSFPTFTFFPRFRRKSALSRSNRCPLPPSPPPPTRWEYHVVHTPTVPRFAK